MNANNKVKREENTSSLLTLFNYLWSYKRLTKSSSSIDLLSLYFSECSMKSIKYSGKEVVESNM